MHRLPVIRSSKRVLAFDNRLRRLSMTMRVQRIGRRLGVSNGRHVLILVVGLIAISPFVNHASAGSIDSSGSTTSYPTNMAHGSCAIYSGYIYCVGGGTGLGSTPAAYYAPISSSGVGAWATTASYFATTYSEDIEGQSCATDSGYIYCVGGQPVSLTGYTTAVDYADLTSNFNNYVTTPSTSTTTSSTSTTTSSTSTTSSSTSTTTSSNVKASTSTSSTTSTTPEFPTGSLAVIALVVMATFAVLSRKVHAKRVTRTS